MTFIATSLMSGIGACDLLHWPGWRRRIAKAVTYSRTWAGPTSPRRRPPRRWYLRRWAMSTEVRAVVGAGHLHLAMAEGDVDVFLGNWMPTMEGDIAQLPRGGHRRYRSVQTLRVRSTRSRPMPRARRWASPIVRRYCRGRPMRWRATIYGIEPGNDGNRLIMDMIDGDAFGLSGFEVVESSEAGHAGAGRPR